MPAAIEEVSIPVVPLDLPAIAANGTPVVLRGAYAHWPLVQAARLSDTDFAQTLAAQDNGAPVDTLLLPPQAQGVIGYNPTLDGFNYQHFRVSVTDVLTRLAHYSRNEATPSPGVALQSALIANCLPGLLRDHVVTGMPPSVQPRLWLGNQVTTPVHFDAFHNLAIVVCGRRRFTLFPPEQVANLYIGPLDFAPTGAAISLAKLDATDDPRFPKLSEALANALTAELEPGDALYLPPLWWHHVASLEPLNALVNYWWQPPMADGSSPTSGMAALLHARLAFSGLPTSERAAWRALLEHYVFSDEDPAAHIPAKRRGVLDALDTTTIATLKQRIANSL